MAVEMVDTTFPFYREASSPCGRQPGSRSARTRRLSRSTKPLRHQGPEQRSRKLPKLLSRVRHGTETHRVTKEGTPLWSLMSEPPHPGQADRTTDLPSHVIVRQYRLPLGINPSCAPTTIEPTDRICRNWWEKRRVTGRLLSVACSCCLQRLARSAPLPIALGPVRLGFLRSALAYA